jgi:fucose permease
MITLLLIVIYLGCIAMGIPHSVFGAAWPEIYTEFGVPVSYSSFTNFLIPGCTVLASLYSTRLLKRIGTAKVAILGIGLIAAASLGYSLSGSFVWLVLFAVPTGFGMGIVDAALNNYIALHYKAIHMNLLHCFIGVGSSLSPYLMSIVFSQNIGWRRGYQIIFFLQLAVVGILVLSLPLWKLTNAVSEVSEDKETQILSIREVLRMKNFSKIALIIIGVNAVEVLCGTWGATFLVEVKSMSLEEGAQVVSIFFVGLTVGRFLAGILSTKIEPWKIIRICILLGLAAIALLLPIPSEVYYAVFFLLGLGVSAVYPNMLHLTPTMFGKEVSSSVMRIEIAIAYTSCMLAPVILGILAQGVGVWSFAYAVVALLVFTGLAYLMVRKHK